MMLPELLVILACTNTTGCSETSAQYFNTHPEVKEIVTYNEKKFKKFLGPVVIQAVGPISYVVAGGTGTIRLSKNFSLQLNLNHQKITYGLEF